MKPFVDISFECGETIPEQFQKVEYIRSNDECGWVHPGYSTSNNTSTIEVFTEFAMMNTYSEDACAFGVDGSALNLIEGFNSGNLGEVEVNVGEYHTYHYQRDWVNNTTYYEIDGTPIKSFEATYERSERFGICCSVWADSPFRFTDLKIKYMKIYQNGVLVRDLVPCYQIIDNAIGMYDYVTRAFYKRIIVNSGDFTKGNDSSVKDIRTNHVKRIADGNGNVIWNKLPDEYQEVEYIGSTGTQYIATSLKVYKDDTVETEFAFDCTDPHDHYLISTYPWGSSNQQRFAMGVYDYGWAAGRFTGGYGATGTSLTYLEPSEDYDHDFHKWRFSNMTFYLDDDKIRDCSGLTYNSSPTNTLYIFYSVSSVTEGRLKNYRQWHDRQLVADFIPCYRKSDSVIGLYDLVTGTFFTNAGSGTFTKGNDI